jgi:hypothetical protein
MHVPYEKDCGMHPFGLKKMNNLYENYKFHKEYNLQNTEETSINMTGLKENFRRADGLGRPLQG